MAIIYKQPLHPLQLYGATKQHNQFCSCCEKGFRRFLASVILWVVAVCRLLAAHVAYVFNIRTQFSRSKAESGSLDCMESPSKNPGAFFEVSCFIWTSVTLEMLQGGIPDFVMAAWFLCNDNGIDRFVCSKHPGLSGQIGKAVLLVAAVKPS
mmetsp:Transcript_40103/g.107528  ORF Transcript_40103/g.107528 Transcript_40103/m.107528 type:complete len:152 (-) Transcript_40103:774-1229(-)